MNELSKDILNQWESELEYMETRLLSFIEIQRGGINHFKNAKIFKLEEVK